MGYILTPTQAENDNKLINNTLESLKTTNLLKQSQDTTINPNLSTQNTQTTQLPPKLPQGKIPQNIADSTQNPQHSNTQKNIGFDSNVLSTQNTAKPLPQNDISTNSTQKPFNTQIALSSDKDFKPQSEVPQQTQIPQIQTPPKKSRLQREIESTKYATNFNQSAYTRNTTAFLGKPHEFSNHKLAMAAKLRLLENFDNNANISDEVFQRYNIIDNAVAALETAKKIHGENSKAYKDILDQYMQYGILKDNGIKDYASLAEFYNKGGNVGIKTEFKASEGNASGLDSVDVDNTKKDETDKKKRNIAEFMTDLKGFHTKDQEKEQKDKGFIDKSTDWLSNTYKFDNKDNLQKQIDNGFSATEGFDILLNGDLDKRKEEYIKKHKLDEKTTLFGEKLDSDSYFANVINPANKYYEGTADFLTFGATSLLEKSEQDLRDFFDYMDMATSVSEGANKSFNEFREKYYDSLMEDNPTKKTQLKEQAYNKLKEAQEKYEKSPAKVYADSSLDRIAETIKHESDYGRIYTFLQDENIQKEKKQQFLSDFANVLKTDERYKDLDSLAFTKDNTLIAIMNEKEGQKAYAINPTLMSSILYTLYAAKSEIIGGIAGGAYGAAKGAKYGKAAGGVGAGVGAVGGALYGSMIGTAIGALTDSQVNRIVTGYLNSDLGAKKAIESGVLDLAGNLALMGIAKGVSKGQEVFSNLNTDSLKEGVNNLKDKAMLLSNGNVNAVTNFLAKNALDNNEREVIKEAAQKEFLNGKSLADYKSDSSIPKLERLKNAWQYEKFINKESMAKGKDKLEALSKEFESFQTTSMESNRPIMSLMQDMFEGKATRHEREKFLRFVSQNEALQSALSGVLAKNPTLALNFGQFIDKRAAQVAKSIESEALTQRMFKDMDSSYAKGLKERYGKVEYDIKRTLDNINFSSTGTKIADILMDLKESIPHVTNAGQTINAMLQKLEARGIKSFEYDMFEYIEPNLNIDDLLNIRKYYNDILRSKDFKNASFKHLQAINKEIDSAVENALQDIAQQSGINTAKLLKNYKDINKEYADYAKFKESDFYKDSVKTKKREKDLSEDNFNKAILKQAQREEGFNNKVFNRIANNTDTNLQAQAIKELIQRNIANGNGQFRAVKWQELIQDLEKIEHSITDEGLKNLVSNLKQAQRLYNGDNEFLQAIQRSVGSKPANVLISSANGLFGRTLLLFYNFVHKIMARFAGALSENLAHQSLEDQLGKALRYARDTKDFIHVSIDSISKNLPKEDKETSKVLKELEYWKAQFDKDDIASFYTIKDAQETQIAITAHKQELQERKEVIDNALSEARKDIETIQKEVIESNPNFMPTRQIDDFDNEATYKMEVEFDKLGMQEFQRKIESGEIQLDKPTQKTLENAYSQYNHLLQKRELLEKDLQSFKAFDDNNILKTNSTLIAQTQRVLNQIQDDISFTKEAIKDIENEIGTSNKALMPLNTHAETKKEIHAFSNLLAPTPTQTKPSFATNLMKQDTQGLIPYNSTQANNALIPYNTPQDTKLLAYNETKLLEYKETLHALQKLDKSFKDFMSMPFSIIVDSKGNALPLTSQAIKNFIFHNLYKEFMSATKALNKPLAQLDFKPLSNEIKALPYKANANLKAHLRDINAKTNELLDSMQEFKNTTKEIKLLPYNKPSENKAVEVDRFRNVLGDNFTTKPNNDKPITDYQVTMEVEPYVRDLAKLKGSEIYADLQNLVNKHREMFDKPSDVFKLIKEIKKNPEFFYNNNRLDAALIVKRLSDNKIGKMGVKKDDGEVIHATKVREKDLIRLKKVSDKFADSVGIIQTFTQQGSKNDKSLNGLPNNETNPTTKQEISKEIESKDIQKTQKETTRASGEKSSNESLTQAKEYTNLIDDFLYQYDLKDDLWFLKYAKLQNAHNRDEVGAALKHLNEVRDNVSTTYDDYVAATEQVKNSLNRAALDIIDDFKATDEAFEAIEKIQTKLLDDYPQTNKNISINTRLEKDSMQIESKSTQESIKDNYIQEVETIAKDFNLTDKEAIQGLINLKDEIGKNVNLLDSVHDRQNSKKLFDNLFKDYWLDFFLANQKAYKSIKDPIALKEKISDIIFSAIQKDNGITPHTKDTHANTKQHSNTTNRTEKETSTKESHTDNKHEATQRENGADTEWITTRTSNNPQENKDTETTLKRDNGISDEYSPSTKEMAQEWNEKTHEKRDIRDDSSHSSSDIEANVNISRDTQGHNAGIRLDETDNKRYKHDGNDDRDNSRTRIHRNVSLKKKGKKDSNTNTESKVATQDIDTPNKDVSATPQHDKETPANTHEKETPKTTREIIKEAKASGKSVRETKELLQQHKDIESNLNNTLESYKAHETATTQLKRSIFEKENELKDLSAEKEKIQQWAETIKEQGNSRALTKIAKELEKIGFDTFSKHPMLDYEVLKAKKVNPRLDGEEFYDESTIINFKDLKKFIKSRDDFIKFKDKLDTLYLADSPYGQARYIHKIKDFSNTKQVGFYQAFSENNYDNIIKELIDKETSKVKNIDNDKIISLQKELEQLKEQLEKTNQSLAQSAKELEQIPFLQKLFNNKPLFNDFLTLRFNTMSEKELKKEAQKALIDIDTSRSYFEKNLNIKPIKEFGTNYAEHYHSGETAIQKLISEAQAHKESGAKGEYKGQVAGAFHRKELGDIDLVWGQVEGKGKEAKGWGLAKIIEKHLNAGDFKAFGEGEAGLINAMSEIIQNGKVITQNGVSTIWYKKDENIYKLGISKGFHKKGDNNWIITSYKAEREKDKTFGDALFTDKHPLPNSSDIIPQKPKEKQSPKELDNIESDSNPAGILNPEELATLNKEFKLGEIQDLKGQKALYDANIESLSLLDDILKSGRVATDDEKRILSNFRGFGKASNELYQVIKEKGERLDSLNKLLESLSESVGAKIDADYLFRRAGDAYYTPTPIVESMVKLAKDLGLNNNHVILEPSSGSGRFLGQFHSNANVVGIELDPFTAKLSQTIYPYFKIDNAGFQNSKFAKDDFYDLVIGNPPYSNFTIRDDNFSASAHNYFMKRGIDKLRVGGISIQIVTKSFMDSSNDLVRKEIAKNAKFLGGVRLPNNAFKDASVTTDILVFKKVSAAEAKKLDNSWVETTELNGIPVSKYFVDNPQNVLGEMKVGKGQFGDIVHVINKEGIDFSNFDLMPYLNKKYDFDTLRLKDNNTHSLKDLESEVKTTQNITDSQMGAVRYDKEQDKFIKNDGGSDDELDLKEYLQSLEVTWKPETIEKRIAEYKELAPKISELQSTLKSLQKAELDSEASNETISALRQKLNSDYEAVVGKNGSFYTKDKKVTPRFKLFEMVDDTSFEIFALEKAPLVKNNKVVGAERADIFTKRVSYPYVRPQSADNLADAMHISLNETGYNDYQRIADLLGSDVDSVKKEFLDKKLEYLDHNGERLNKDIFLSGDVKTRLESFHDEYGLPKFSDDETIAHYQKIAYEDLKNVIPDDIEVPHIEIPLGANWLDKNITDSFLSEIVGLDYLNTNYIHGAGWKVNFDGLKDRDFMIATGKDFKANTGVEYINGIDYIEDMLNNKTLVVQKTIKGHKDKTIIYRDPIATQSLEALKKQLKREFKQYILDNDSFSEIAQKQYNDTFNREVARKYDGSHLKLHGANSDIELRKHQKNAVFRFFQELSSLLAHDVGTGKSYTMIASAIEGKRLKVHNKPMIVLPNHVAPQIAAEARRLYPNANIKLIQAVSRKDKNRQLASLKNNSHDIIITTYTAFTNMNVAPSAFQDYVEKEIKFLRQIQKKLKEDGNASKRELNSIEKRIEKAVERATNYAKSVANDKQNVFFEDLGIDTLMFDEAHYLKNLPIFTAQRNVRGIGQADSQRAIDAFMKISQMRDLPNNRVLFATGTPITNFISDIFTMQRFLGSKDLEAKGIDVFDEWCKMFAGASSEFEMKATGEYKLTSRLRDFSNLPELKAMYYKFADLVTKEDMQKAILEEGGKIIEPKVRRIPVVLKRNQAQIDFMESVKKRAKVLQENPQAAMEKGGDNMLKIISDSNKASIDMRLIDSSYKRDGNGKISAAANNILEVYNDFNTHKGTQLVFLDTSVPKKAVKPETLEKWQKELERLDSVIQNQSHNLSDNQLEKLRDKASDLESKIARGSDGFSAYNDLKDLLIEKGIKENEVAFVHDFEGIKKETLSQKINSGEIRVLIGSTSKMGAGSNFQERLAAIHHLDLDWTPANMEQREGRIIRQGNRLMDLVPDFEARIYTYVTEQMSDSLMLQTLEQKTKIIKQIQDPNLKTRVIEDISEDNLHGRLKAMTSPNAEQELEAMNIVKSIDEVENAISTHDLILKNNHNKIENANKLESSMQKDINTLEAFKKQTQDNTTISFGKEKINFAKDNKAKTSKDNKTDTPKATKESKDKKKEKSPESLANEKLNAIIQDFAKSSDNLKVICEYRGLNILAKKGYGGMIDFYLGKDLNEALSISIRLDVKDAAYTDKNYMQRFNNGYNKLISDEYIKELQGQIQKAKDTREKAKKAYEKEIANKESVAELRNSLNEMLVRQAELHSFLGRASDSEIERLKAIYGDDFEDIVKGKFSKESENKALDNNTANNIAENDLEQTLEPTMQKFNYDERKAKDLLEWHKDSSPLTKDENGLPKVFYHGTRESIGNKEILTPKHTDDTGQNYPARFFSSSHNVALSYTKELPNSDNGIYKVFLNAKNPLVIDFQGKDFVDRSELADKIYKGEQYFDLAIRKALDEAKESGKPFDSVIYKNVRDERYGRSKEISDTIAIFNPNQIKHIDNKGSYTDTKGNITKTKPKNKESTHTYFNDKSPNIMYANPKHLGSGLISGSVAGIETDENGNIVGFNPQNFVLGLIGGSVASKAISKLYNNESTQRYATLAIKSIQQDYKSLSENNPAMFAKIMQKFNPRDFLKGKKEINSLSNEIFNKELAKAIESALQNGKVETMPQAEFRNKEEFAKMFDSISGKYGIIETPYKEVKADIKSAWKHFTYNTHNTDRENIKGGFFKTFKDPLFIAEQAREGQSSPSVYFYKPFYDNDKKLMNLFGIGIDSVGNIDFKTYYFDKKENRLKEMLMSDKIKIVYMQENP